MPSSSGLEFTRKLKTTVFMSQVPAGGPTTTVSGIIGSIVIGEYPV